jgi:uncharacterized membrane protein HdeD (DUF308 family)
MLRSGGESKENEMFELLGRYWWVVLIRGLLAILFGVAAFTWPHLTLLTLVLLFGAFALVDGAFAVVAAISSRKQSSDWGLLLLAGLLGIAIGVLTYHNPAITALALVLYIAAWALVRGVVDIVAAIRLRAEIEGEWLMALGGVASIAFALLVLWAPGAGALAMLWMIGAWAIFFGTVLVVLAFRLRARHHTHHIGGMATPRPA